MLNINFIRENKDLVLNGAKKKHIDFDVDELISLDDQRKDLLQRVEEKRAEQNEVGKDIAQKTGDEKENLLKEMTELKESLQKEEAELKEIMIKWQDMMLRVPNIPDMSVPEGIDDSGNVEIRVWGERPKMDFAPKTHIDLMIKHDLVDFEVGTMVAGFRGYILKNEAVLLQFALEHFALDTLVKKGFTPMIVPSMVRRDTLLGTGYIPQGEDDLYKTQDDMYLAGTGEVATMSYYKDQVIEKEKLPIKMLAYSTCFRREIGTHGKDTKGLKRVHEFYKLEQVILCEGSHEESVKIHEELTNNSEEIIQALKLPYRLVVNCGGDLGLGQVKKYDIETWCAGSSSYIETHSSSYFHDFQTRRLNIKYSDTDGKKKFVHSLNNTALAFPRVLIPIIENYQQEDGTIAIPEVLQPYMNGKKFIGK